MIETVRQRTASLASSTVCFAVAVLLSTTAWAQHDQASEPTPGCSLKGVSESVKQIFGPFDSAMQNSGAQQGAEIPGLAKVAAARITMCVFQRISPRESLQVVSYEYANAQDAIDLFQNMSKVRNTQGPFYTSDLQRDGVSMHQGPGRLAARVGGRVVIVHWSVLTPSHRIQPSDTPGEKLAPIALVILH